MESNQKGQVKNNNFFFKKKLNTVFEIDNKQADVSCSFGGNESYRSPKIK